MKGSPHIRYDKVALYQGEWGGVPLLTPFKPHGEGLIIFMSTWRFGKEKVLYFTIVKCSELHQNPLGVYCLASCGGHKRRTLLKRDTLDPEFHESYEIDVTDPSSVLCVDVMEIGLQDDICVGKIQVKFYFTVRALADNRFVSLSLLMEKKDKRVMNLKGNTSMINSLKKKSSLEREKRSPSV